MLRMLLFRMTLEKECPISKQHIYSNVLIFSHSPLTLTSCIFDSMLNPVPFLINAGLLGYTTLGQDGNFPLCSEHGLGMTRMVMDGQQLEQYQHVNE